VKRVHQELGGKSPNIILDDADLAAAVTENIYRLMLNSGQGCAAPTRMLVPFDKMDTAKSIAKQVVTSITYGDPQTDVYMGPVVSERQWKRIQSMISKGIEEGATLLAGGTGHPDGLEIGYYVKPTVFVDVTNDMTIAREEIFGPVLCIIGYKDVDDAVSIANDTVYGLAAYVQSASEECSTSPTIGRAPRKWPASSRTATRRKVYFGLSTPVLGGSKGTSGGFRAQDVGSSASP
jgi:aldehyde dehydrogenase (NAD+)